MRILHVLWGYSPWREGGLVLYAEELMKAQNMSGDQVAAFFAGRRRFFGGPKLSVWNRDGVQCFEVENSPLVHLGRDGTFPAVKELGEPVSESFLLETLELFRPDVVHIHELAGLPFTLIDLCKSRNLPLVMTLHDYFTLCPTLNYFNREGHNCHGGTPESCAHCCGRGTDGGLYDRVRTLRAEGRKPLLYAVPLVIRLLYDLMGGCRRVSQMDLIDIYRRRLQENVRRFQLVDAVISQSTRTKEIYEQQTGRKDIRVLHSSLSHVTAIHPRRIESIQAPVRFATLNGAIAPHKGAQVLRECVEILKERGLEGNYRLDVFGRIHRDVKTSLLSSSSVRWRGQYHREDLNLLLNEFDVGIIPSICEEVYGYVGIEFLAKGIPVIGNKRGGIIDYTFEGQSGWLNESCSASELADTMEEIIRNPGIVPEYNAWIIANRDLLVPDMANHLSQIKGCYSDVMAKFKDCR